MATKTYDGSSTQEISFTADPAGSLLQVSNIDGWSEYRSGDDLIIFSSDKTNYLRVIGAYASDASATKLDFIEYFFDGKSSGEIRSVSTIATTPASGLHFIAGTFENDIIDGASASSLSATGYLGNDQITGSDGPDYLGGNEGNDTIVSGTGNDVLLGGSGNDTLDGGDGDDYIDGGDGDDTIFGGAGNDIIDDGLGSDVVDAGDGIDTYTREFNDNTWIPHVDLMNEGLFSPTFPDIKGDTLISFENVDLKSTVDVIITGNDDNNILSSGSGNDKIYGGDGDDTLDGGSGVNHLEGGEGDDVYSYAYNCIDTISDSGGNNDTVYLIARDAEDIPYFGDAYVENDKLIFVSSKNSSHTLTVEDAFSTGGRIEKITFHAESGRWSDYTLRIASVDDNPDGSDISYWGTHSDDVIQMNDGYNEAYSSAGNDTILAGDGGSWISAGEGDDKIIGGLGVDYIVGDNFYTSKTGADLISAGEGDDVIYLAASEAYNYWLSAKNVSSNFQTGTQELINLKKFLRTEDVVDGGADADTIHLDSGNIALFLHDAFTAFHEEASLSKDSYGNKSVQRIDNIENIFGYDGDNLIDLTSPDYSLAGQNIKISGGNGDDIIWGSDADENILGDAGNDVLFGGAGTNILTGGSGADEFQFTHTSIADTISDYSKADGDVLKFYVRSGAPEATAEFSINGNQLVWGDNAITLDGYTNLSGNDLTIKKQIIGSTLLEDVLINELPPSLSISLSKDAKTFISDGLNAERDVQIISNKLSGFYEGINGANAIFRTLENETVTNQDAITVSNQGISITSDRGYELSLEFSNFSPTSLSQLQTMFKNAKDINDISLSGGFQRITLADPDGGTLLQLSHSSNGITWENPNADAGAVDTFMIKGSFENQIKDYIDFIKNVDAAANTQPSPSSFVNLFEELNSLIQLDGLSATGDGKTVFDFTAKEDGTLTLTLMGTGGDHVLEFGLGLDGIEQIGNDLIALAGGEDAFFNMLFEDPVPNNIQQYLSDISNLDEIELTLGYDFANKELIDIKLTDFSRLDSLNVDPFILKDLKIFDSSTDELRITTVANPTGEVVINLVGYNQYEVSSAIETVSSYAYNDFGMLLEELFIPDQNLLML